MNLLLIQLKRIGDLILTVPAIATLRRHFPEAKISLVVGYGPHELVPAIPNLDRVLVARGRLSDAAQWFALAKAKFDYCLDFSRTDRSAFLTALSGARKRITYDTVRRKPVRQLGYNEFVPSSVRLLHTVDYHLALLAPLGVHNASPEIHLVLPQAAEEKAGELIAQKNLGDDFIVIHPGSARSEKFWVARRWAEVIDRFSGRARMRFVLTGSGSSLEQQHIARIKSHLRERIVDLSGQLDLLTLAALIKRTRLLATIDSAPMHLAAAFGTPQVVLFGPTNPFHWRPRGSRAVILHGGSRSPATDFVPKRAATEMKEISTETVIDAMQSLLSSAAAPVS